MANKASETVQKLATDPFRIPAAALIGHNGEIRMIINDDRTAANKAFDVAVQGDTTTIDDDMAALFEAHRIAAEARGAAKRGAEIVDLREAIQRLRNGYADAVSGLSYILLTHGRLSGVGFDRVMDHFSEWVTIPEREGLLSGSHTIARHADQGEGL